MVPGGGIEPPTRGFSVRISFDGFLGETLVNCGVEAGE